MVGVKNDVEASYPRYLFDSVRAFLLCLSMGENPRVAVASVWDLFKPTFNQVTGPCYLVKKWTFVDYVRTC